MIEGDQASGRTWWNTPLLSRLGKLQQREDQVFLALALVIGALTGAVVVAFILLTERMGMRLYPVGGAPSRRLFFPVVGSLGIGYLLSRYFPYARGSGVPQTKAALYAREGRITLRTVLGKFFCTSATLASGIPLGREGPSVQVGAGIASVLGRFLGLRPEKVKALLPVGAAAAIAAAFNTPLAAVAFALEEIVGDLHAPLLGSVVLASATSWGVLRLLLGNSPLFKVPQYQLVHPAEFAIYAVLGVAGGLVSVAFTKMLLGMRERFLRLPANTFWFHPLAGGLLVGVVCWLWICRPRVEWQHGLNAHGCAGDSKTHHSYYELRFRQCRRHFRPGPVYRCHAGRFSGNSRTSFVPCLYSKFGGLRVSWDGRSICWHCARPD